MKTIISLTIQKSACVLALLSCIWLSQPTGAQTFSFSTAWNAANGVGHLANNSDNRGVAYSVVSNEVFVATRSTATTGFIDVFDGTTGTLLSGSGGITGANLGIDQIGVGNDGVLYGAPLQTSVSSTTGSLTVYSWTNWFINPTPYAAYVSASGDSVAANFSGKRIGDTMAVTGSGVNTLILMGVGGQGTNFVLLHTADGINFTPTAVFVPTGLPSTAGNIFGISFYTNNSFLVIPGANATSHNVYLVSFPANYAGQTTVVGTVLGNFGTLTANYTTAINYSPAGQMLAVVQTASAAVNTNAIYSLANFPASALELAGTTFATPNSNGNATGGGALGGQGKTNFLYVLESNNGLQAYAINFTSAPQAPSITSQPVGATIYPPYKLTVGASGTAPLYYQWQVTNRAVAEGFTNIPGANTNFYTVSVVSTNFYRVIVTNSVAPPATSSVALVTILRPVLNAAVTNLWQVAPGQSGYPWLSSSDNNERGIAYDTNSQRVVVATTSALYVLNGNNGTNIETLSLAGVSFSGLLGGCDQVGIADDGAVYAGNLINAGGNFNLYRWSAPSNIVTATQAFGGDPGNGAAGSERWGDTMAVRGAGPNTQILLASRAAAPGGTNVALLTPDDGVGLTYSSTLIAVSGVPAGFAGYGISFGAGNTFWSKSVGGDLYEISFDPVALTGTVIFDYHQPTQISSTLTGLGVDPVDNILTGVQLNDNPNDFQLFQLTGTSDSPVLFDQAFFASANANGNDNGAVVVKYPRAYALDVNNGIVAVTYGVPAVTAPAISSPPASITVYTNAPSVAFSVGASGSLPLYYQWRFNSNNIAGATSSTYTITNPPLSEAGYYDVVVHNIAGSLTSSPPALLTLVVPVTSPQVTPVWSISAGTNSSVNGPYLTTSGYETRGLAFDLTTSNLFIADHYFIHEYNGTNGEYVGDLNTAGLPTGGINGWTVDQIGTADDGTLYSCNLSPDGTVFSIISYAPGTYSLNYAYGGSTGGNDLNTLDPAGDRWGDTMAVRGSGPDTQILLGSYNGTNVALFTTPDGVNFMPTVIAVQGSVPAGFAGLGIAFGTNDTFYAKGGHSYNLRWVAFDTNANTGTVLQTYTAGIQVPNDLAGVAVDVANDILGGVCFNDTPTDVQLYLLSGNANGPSLFNQDFFPANNVNSQENAVVAMKGGWGFGLNVNNGVVGFTYGMPNAPAVTLTSIGYAPGSTTLNWNNTFDGHGYQVQFKVHLLDATWTNLGLPATATNAMASYTDATAFGGTRFYRIVSQ